MSFVTVALRKSFLQVSLIMIIVFWDITTRSSIDRYQLRRNPLPPSCTVLSTIPLSCMKSVTAGTDAMTGERTEKQSCEIPEYGIGAFSVLSY